MMEQNKPLISVLMTTYNVESFIAESVESILNQTYTNLEFVIVDDCSSDATYQILQTYAAEDSRIKLFRNKKNLKIAEALNFGLTQVTGEFVVRMDGDDTCSLDRIEKQYNFLMNHPDVSLVGTQINIVDEKGNGLRTFRKCTDPEKMIKYSRYATPVFHIWMTRKSIYDNVGKYRLPCAEDYDFVLRVLSSGYKVSNVDEYLYNVRVRGGNTVSASGYRQFESANYAYSLFKHRMKHATQRDGFSIDEIEKRVAINKLHDWLFKKSCHFYMLAYQSFKTNRLKTFIYIILSFSLAPMYRFTLLYRSFMMRIY